MPHAATWNVSYIAACDLLVHTYIHTPIYVLHRNMQFSSSCNTLHKTSKRQNIVEFSFLTLFLNYTTATQAM